MMNLRSASVITCAVFFAVFSTLLGGQDVELPAQDAALRELIAQRSELQMYGLGPFDFTDQLTSPDSQALGILNQASSGGADTLRAVTDLLSLYQNLQCDTDRTMMKPMLIDRLHLYSRLLDKDAERAAIPLGMMKEPANTKKALKLRDTLVAAKKAVDTVAISLN